jgi:NTE family protein
MIESKKLYRDRMDITLALGGGGLKGNAHIGVIRALEQEGFRVKAVAGTSAGGIAAAAYAAGYSSDEILEFLRRVDQTELFGRDPKDGPAFLGVAGVRHILDDLLGERTFGSMSIPLAVTATDLDHGREVILREGSVVDAVLATIALPGVLPPQSYHGSMLVDGGVLDPVPVRVARMLAPDLPVVAVVLSSPLEDPLIHLSPATIPGPQPVVRQLTRLRFGKALEIFAQSIDLGARAMTEMRLKLDKPDVIIRPKLGALTILSKVDVDQMVMVGEAATLAKIPELKQACSWQRSLIRRVRYRNLLNNLFDGYEA